jgi:hypothetical protein
VVGARRIAFLFSHPDTISTRTRLSKNMRKKLRKSLMEGVARIGMLLAKRKHPEVQGLILRQGETEASDIPPPKFTPREKYLDEAPSGRLGALLHQALRDHPEFEVGEFSHKNIRNWSVRVPGTISLENGDQVQAEVQVESHLVGYEELSPEDTAKGKQPEPIFSERAELVVTGMRPKAMAKPLVGYRYQNECDLFMEKLEPPIDSGTARQGF